MEGEIHIFKTRVDRARERVKEWMTSTTKLRNGSNERFIFQSQRKRHPVKKIERVEHESC